MTTDRPTSYFSTPSDTLDPNLFEGRRIRSWVRQGILNLLQDFLNLRYKNAEQWAHAWLAGSGVSYQWSAARQPADLDCLVGVDFVSFRRANPEFAGLTDKEIASTLNDDFHDELQGQTENWNGYELTFYVNPGATDIRAIHPYAAYDLQFDEWTVTPDPQQTAPSNPEWESVVNGDAVLAQQVHTRFTQAMMDLQQTRAGAAQRNAETRMNAAIQQGVALYNEIHENRSQAFSPTGEGYSDFSNYRWQAGKRSGTIDLLREIREHAKEAQSTAYASLYGVDLPDSSTLIRRAALYGRR